MDWRIKALIQNIIDRLPRSLSYKFYYSIQRNFGSLKNINHLTYIEEYANIIRTILSQKHVVSSKTFLEIGTGWSIAGPICLYLCGAARIITVDINPYLKYKLVLESIEQIRHNRDKVETMLNGISNKSDLWERLDILLSSPHQTLKKLLALMNIEYVVLTNGASLHFEDNIADFHFSNNVLEHIPYSVIKQLLLEGRRVLSDKGLFVHTITLLDHFSQSDTTISSVNFLQYTERKWNNLTGNKFMYHNRLRAHDYYHLFNEVGLEILTRIEYIDREAQKLLESGNFPISQEFKDYTAKELSISHLNIIAKYKPEKNYNIGTENCAN